MAKSISLSSEHKSASVQKTLPAAFVPLSEIQKTSEELSHDEEKVSLSPASIAEKKHVSYELCMVFDAPKENQASRLNAPHFTGPSMVDLLRQAGLEILLYLSVQKDEVYCLIGASEERLENEAQRIEYDLPLDRDSCLNYGISGGVTLAKVTKERDQYSNLITDSLWENLYGKFTIASRVLYKKNFEDAAHAGSVFSEADRIKLIISIIEAEVKMGGAGLAIGNILNEKNSHLLAFFALHNENQKNRLKPLMMNRKNFFQIPVDDIRSYFGEEIALYFSFLGNALVFFCLQISDTISSFL